MRSQSNPPSRAVDELPAALQLAPGAWQDKYHFPKPGPGTPVVMQCRTNRRASWAAQLAHDAGLGSVFVYKQVRSAKVLLEFRKSWQVQLQVILREAF